MRAIHYTVVTVVCLGALWILWYNSIFNVYWQFDLLEQHAKTGITGDQLQSWALNLLERHPTTVTNTSPDISDLGANFPRQLLGLYHHPPYIQINKHTDTPTYVLVMWGGGMIGHRGFEIGATNFIGRGHAWQPGMYFWRDSH